VFYSWPSIGTAVVNKESFNKFLDLDNPAPDLDLIHCSFFGGGNKYENEIERLHSMRYKTALGFTIGSQTSDSRALEFLYVSVQSGVNNVVSSQLQCN